MDDPTASALAPIRLALLGAAGLAGEAVVRLLDERKFPAATLTLLGGGKALGRHLEFRGEELGLTDLASVDFSQIDLLISVASSKVAAEWLPRARAAGCAVVDSSAAFRGRADVPLVMPGVTDGALQLASGRAAPWAAVPGAFVGPLARVLAPLHALGGLRTLEITGLAAVSGAGRGAVEELAGQTVRMLNGMDAGEPRLLQRRMAFNVIPTVDDLDDLGSGTGQGTQEAELEPELQRLLGVPALAVNATLVRVPVFFGHSWVVAARFRAPVTPAAAAAALADLPGVFLSPDPSLGYPTPVTEAADQNGLYVGRIRADTTSVNGLNFWLVADNIRAGVALPCVQLAEAMLAHRW